MTPRGSPPRWRIFRARLEEPLVTASAGALLLALVFLPLASAIGGTRLDLDDSHLDIRILGRLHVTATLLLRSTLLAAAVTAVAATIGVPLGYALSKAPVRARRWALVLHSFPLFLPPFLLALGWFYLFGRGGSLGSSLATAVLFSPVGATIVMALAFAPVFTCLTMLGLAAIDPSLEEAGRLVASPFLVARSILLPATWRAQVLAALIVFTLAFSELGVPSFLRVRAYSTAVFSQLGGLDPAPGAAAALALPLIAVAAVLLWIEQVAFRGRPFDVVGLRGKEGAALAASGDRQSVVTFAVWAVTVLSLIPIAGLIMTAARGGFGAAPAWIGQSLATSLWTGAIASAAALPLALVIGRASARGRPGARLLDSAAVLAFITPAPLLAVGIVGLWNREATAFVYGTTTIIILGYVTRYLAIGARTIGSAVVQVPSSSEEAAAMAGAGYLRRLRTIVVPTSSRGIVAASLLVFVFCLRDLETTVFYYPPGRETLLVRILTLEANGPEPVVAALAVIHVLVTGLFVAGGALLALRTKV